MSAASHVTDRALAWALAQPVPSPTLPASTVPEESVTPGVWGFVAIAFVAVATVLIVVDMSRRVRRTRYRGEVRERIQAERDEAALAAAALDDEELPGDADRRARSGDGDGDNGRPDDDTDRRRRERDS